MLASAAGTGCTWAGTAGCGPPPCCSASPPRSSGTGPTR